MSLVSSTAKITSNTGFFDFPIEQSLRFDGSSYLMRRLTATGNQKVWTFSCWVKRSKLSTLQYIFSFGSNGGGNDGIATFAFDPNNSFYAYFDSSSTNPYGPVSTTHLMRDTSAFYHIVWQVSVGAAVGANYWINNQKVENPAVQPPDYNYGNQSGWDMAIGAQAWAPTSPYLSSCLANIQFIDGQALDPYFFGESKNGVWIPYNAFSTAGSGTATASDGDTATDSYGTNGFHLTFEDATSTTTLGYDYSGNNNHWTLN